MYFISIHGGQDHPLFLDKSAQLGSVLELGNGAPQLILEGCLLVCLASQPVALKFQLRNTSTTDQKQNADATNASDKQGGPSNCPPGPFRGRGP